MEIRALEPQEIECRVSQVSQKGVSLLLYKDARCDMAILDETFGPFGWQRKHEFIGGKEFCTVSVYDEDRGWVSKQDCGTESNTEKEKGQSSDAFKRACFCWGIGRELYTKIHIFIQVPTQKNDKGRYEMADKYAKYHVTEIETDNTAKKIKHIKIADDQNNLVFEWDHAKGRIYSKDSRQKSSTTAKQQNDVPAVSGEKITEEQVAHLQTVLNDAGKDVQLICISAKVDSLADLTQKQYDNYIAMFTKR